MQGVCDGNTIFTGVSCKHVGSTNDSPAYMTSSLKQLCESQPEPYHWNGDNAYGDSQYLMTPYKGINLHITHPSRDWFNFWHSQIRITIERCFGIFIQRWGIFWSALKYSVLHNIAIVHACVRLHNFIMKRKVPVLINHHVPPPHVALDENGRLVDNAWRLNAEPHENYGGSSGCTLKQVLLEKIERNNWCHERSHNVY
jgi:hypothetical protein